MKIIIYILVFGFFVSGCGTNSSVLKNTELKERTATALENRNEISYLPNENEPFTGKYEKYYSNGQKEAETNYKNGKADGLSTGWHDNGKKEAEINYKDGKADGLCTFWYKNGQKKHEEIYKDDKLNGLVTRWHENGKKESETIYKDGEVNGLATQWYKNGQKETETNFIDGKFNGLFTAWDENGQKSSEINYKDGEVIALENNSEASIIDSIEAKNQADESEVRHIEEYMKELDNELKSYKSYRSKLNALERSVLFIDNAYNNHKITIEEAEERQIAMAAKTCGVKIEELEASGLKLDKNKVEKGGCYDFRNLNKPRNIWGFQ